MRTTRLIDPGVTDAPGIGGPPDDPPELCECSCTPCLAIANDEAPPEAEHCGEGDCHALDCDDGIDELDDGWRGDYVVDAYGR